MEMEPHVSDAMESCGDQRRICVGSAEDSMPAWIVTELHGVCQQPTIAEFVTETTVASVAMESRVPMPHWIIVECVTAR